MKLEFSDDQNPFKLLLTTTEGNSAEFTNEYGNILDNDDVYLERNFQSVLALTFGFLLKNVVLGN